MDLTQWLIMNWIKKIKEDVKKRLDDEKLKKENEFKAISPFGEIFLKYYEKINSVNKFDKSDVFNDYKKSICNLPREFKNWPLIVSDTRVTDYGGNYALVDFNTIKFKQVYVHLRMTGTGAASSSPLIEDGFNNLSRGSDLFNKIKLLKNGDKVIVSGKLMSGIGCNVETGIVGDNFLSYGAFYLNFYLKDIDKQ